MIARCCRRRALGALLAPTCGLLALPGVALASGTGGGGLAGGTGTTGTPSPVTTPTADPSAPVSATGDGVTLSTSSATALRGRLVLTGTATGAAGQTLEIERRAATPGASWQSALSTTVSSTGSFRAVWRTDQSGRVALRALVVSGSRARTAAPPPTLTVTVYPTSRATLYGPGFYGRRTACGGHLQRSTIGVANRSLPCGTKVSILYDGRTLTVPVIDRGPYANGASWDLTMATAQALGIQGTEQIGTIALGGSTPVAPARRNGGL